VHTEQLDAGLFRSVAPNGLVILTEHLPAVRSVAVGVWVRAGSGHEPASQWDLPPPRAPGVQGHRARTAKELALALEERGGSLDAWTGRDASSFQAHVLDEDLPLALEVLTDLVRHPLLRPADLELERQVVLEEISSVDDAPTTRLRSCTPRRCGPTTRSGARSSARPRPSAPSRPPTCAHTMPPLTIPATP